MKGLIVFMCVATITVLAQRPTESELQQLKTAHDECQSHPATHVDEELLMKFRKQEEVDESIVGPHVLCISTKLGLQKKNGDIDSAVLRTKFNRESQITDEEKLNKAVEECAVQESTPEETAIALSKCVYEHVGQSHHHHHHHQ